MHYQILVLVISLIAIVASITTQTTLPNSVALIGILLLSVHSLVQIKSASVSEQESRNSSETPEASDSEHMQLSTETRVLLEDCRKISYENGLYDMTKMQEEIASTVGVRLMRIWEDDNRLYIGYIDRTTLHAAYVVEDEKVKRLIHKLPQYHDLPDRHLFG